jgi:hypothetical protein
MTTWLSNLRGLHPVVLVFFVVHGVLEPFSATAPSVVGYIWPPLYYWLFGEQSGSPALAYAFRSFSSLNSFAGCMLVRVVAWPLLKKGSYTPKEYALVVFTLVALLVSGDLPYSLASVLAKLADPGLGWRIWLPFALDMLLVVSKLVFLPAALVIKYGGVKAKDQVTERSPLLANQEIFGNQRDMMLKM